MAFVTIRRILIALSLLHLCTGGHEHMDRRLANEMPNWNNLPSDRDERRVLQLQNDISISRDLACPPADMIKPCVCTLDNGMDIDMDCSLVASEDELAEVFAQDFPFLNFRQLTIDGNQNLKVLRSGALGMTTYQTFHVTYGVLEEVEPYALASSYLTAEYMFFNDNKISVFPFSKINHFVKLRKLELIANSLATFPTIASSSLTYLGLGDNAFHSNIDSEALQQLPQIEAVEVYKTGLTEIYEGTFTRLPHLSRVYLYDNHLTNLPNGIIDLNDNPGSYIFFDTNSIASVAPNAITGVEQSISFAANSLRKLEENVWRKHLEKGVVLSLAYNPFDCGCDLAWVVLNRTFMGQISRGSTCADGTHLSDLKPNDFADC